MSRYLFPVCLVDLAVDRKRAILLGLLELNLLQVIIDSQPLTVAILAALLFGESIGLIGGAGLILGVVGLLLLEVILVSPVVL